MLSFAQIQLKTSSEYGTVIYDINTSGAGIHGNGYYDFQSNTSSVPEDGILETDAINDAGQVLGFLLEGEDQ